MIAKHGKKFTILGILIVLLAAVYVFGFSGKLGEQPKLPAFNQLATGLENKGDSTTGPTPAMAPTLVMAPPATATAISAISNSLKEVVSAKFPVKGTLAIQRVWVVGEDYFYVEYLDSRQPRRVLVQVTGRSPLQFTALGYFTPSQNDWTLEKGQDKLFKDQVWALYEFEAASGTWVKKN